MRFVLFYHSFVSCWNHGNVHFLRGVTRALLARGHSVAVYEPSDGWSRTNALAEAGGAQVLDECAGLVPGVEIRPYRLATLDLDRALDGADVVIAHEWNVPALIERLGRARLQGHFTLLFHDTHHRAVSDPAALDRIDLDAFDAVLAFGEVLREVYLRRGWGRRVVTWHEAADTALFKPQPHASKSTDLVWIGNWGDGERDAELQSFLVEPVMLAGAHARLHGVRYPDAVRNKLRAQGFALAGWLPNHRAPAAFAGARFTVHVPRRPYVEALPGIPTIRVFEALACGLPLISAPWIDAEGLFPGGSYLEARNTAEMAQAMRSVMAEPARAADVARRGLAAIAARHTCAHRADELLALLGGLAARGSASARAQSSSPQQTVPP
jgi:spore maturation protein CgeB